MIRDLSWGRRGWLVIGENKVEPRDGEASLSSWPERFLIEILN